MPHIGNMQHQIGQLKKSDAINLVIARHKIPLLSLLYINTVMIVTKIGKRKKPARAKSRAKQIERQQCKRRVAQEATYSLPCLRAEISVHRQFLHVLAITYAELRKLTELHEGNARHLENGGACKSHKALSVPNLSHLYVNKKPT